MSEVNIEVRGLEEVMARLDYDSISCVVDLRDLSPGKKYTQEVKVNLPPRVSLVSSTPSQVVVDLLRQVVRLMTVEVALPQDIPTASIWRASRSSRRRWPSAAARRTSPR